MRIIFVPKNFALVGGFLAELAYSSADNFVGLVAIRNIHAGYYSADTHPFSRVFFQLKINGYYPSIYKLCARIFDA